jgi:2-dehydro-3-deoxy-D-arabinonate dehydratase
LLSTGTGIVPGLDFTVLPGDQIRITIEGLMDLENTVMVVGAETTADHDDPEHYAV